MFQIGIYEENTTDLKKLHEFFIRLENKGPYSFKLSNFSSEDDLITHYKNPKKIKPQVIIMNIKLSTCNGIDIASKIRKYYDQEVLIVFHTNYIEYIMRSFDVQAFQYWLKPINYSFFEQKMLLICKHIYSLKSIFFPVKADGDYLFVRCADIMYIRTIKCQNSSNNIEITTKSGTILFTGTLLKCIAKLQHPFYLIHRSFIININHALKIRSNYVVMNNGEEIPIGKSKTKTVKLALSYS